MKAKSKLIESGSKDITSIKLSDGEIERATESLQQIMASLVKKYGKEAVNDTFITTPFKDPIVSAQVMLSFYELLLAKGEEEGGLLFKFLYMPSPDSQKKS